MGGYNIKKKHMTSDNIIIRPKPLDLAITVKQVARYAGGSRYRMDADMEKKALSVLEEAINLIDPALVYSIHEISHLHYDIRTGLFLPENTDETPKVAGCICTLGPKLETAVSEAMQTGDGLHGALLDAAGVGLLESLGHLSFSHIRTEARQHNLYAGCRSGPGYNHVPMEAQVHLFSMADPTDIGVSLTRSFVMIPSKSLSFFVVLHKHSHGDTDGYKCGVCDLADCPYRIGNEERA
jgi:hypothetical protein